MQIDYCRRQKLDTITAVATDTLKTLVANELKST